MISLENLGRSFDEKWAVRGLSLDVPKGEVFGLLGPNGAGKTTAIKMMTGLLTPTEGKVLMGGYDMAVEPLKAKSVMGYVPDRAFFYEKLTVREHLIFIASIYGLKKDDALAKVERLLEIFGIKEIEGSLIESCSQGMRQRVLFASALLHEPSALLIDEPFVGLDPFGVSLIKDFLRALSGAGVAVFLATHSLHIAAELCHRVGLIDRGRLVSLKRKEDLTVGLEEFFMEELSKEK